MKRLTPRETAVLDAYIREGVNKRIAARLGISLQSVKAHISSIIAKLHAASMGQAAVRYTLLTGRRTERRRGTDRRSGQERRHW